MHTERVAPAVIRATSPVVQTLLRREREPETSMRQSRIRGWALWAAVALVFASSSSPSIAQHVPRLLLPAAGAAGAVLVTIAFVSSLGRLVRGYRKAGMLSLRPVLITFVALVFLVILPATHLQPALTPSRDRAPRILAGSGDWFGSEGYPLFRRHRGLDIAGEHIPPKGPADGPSVLDPGGAQDQHGTMALWPTQAGPRSSPACSARMRFSADAAIRGCGDN